MNMGHQPDSGEKQAAVKRLQDFVGERRIEGVPAFCFYDEVPDRAKALTGGTDLGELLQLAQQGDVHALAQYVIRLRAYCEELELLTNKQESFVKPLACLCTDWPVVASPFRVRNKGELRELLERLDVGGDKAELPAYATQKHDPRNLWTRYALAITRYLRMARTQTAQRLEECKRADAEFHSPMRILRTTHNATWYAVDGKRVVIPEWQKQCLNLPARLTKENAKVFMNVAGIALREFWCAHPEHFEQVKEKIDGARKSKTDKTVGQYVDLALRNITQALAGIAHKE